MADTLRDIEPLLVQRFRSHVEFGREGQAVNPPPYPSPTRGEGTRTITPSPLMGEGGGGGGATRNDVSR